MVQASGEKSLPSVPSSVNTGKKPTVITSSEKKMGRPTSCSPPSTTSARGSLRPSRSHLSSRLCTFSTTMMAASTIAPMAMAIPPRDMMFAVSPICFMGMNAATTAMGRSSVGIRVDRKCSRKTRMTAATAISSSISVRRKVSMLARISRERS